MLYFYYAIYKYCQYHKDQDDVYRTMDICYVLKMPEAWQHDEESQSDTAHLRNP